MDYKRARNLPEIFFQQAEKLDENPFLWAKKDGTYQAWTWSRVRREVICLATALDRFGVKPGDRVLLVSENRPEWFVADFAIMSLGAITVPAYTTNRPGDHLHILTDSGACAAIVSTEQLAQPLREALREAPHCPHLIAMEPLAEGEASPKTVLWQELLEQGTDSSATLEARIAAIAREDVACLIYTSGTGGAPKGVMLSHGNILANCLSAHDLL
ncbi:MAG TPA: AMP-binding protein, partial [Kiloniellales bacterium]|nr:AMP-binding protein [Kiloniellales bacterium]